VSPGRTTLPFQFRMKPALRDLLEQAAEQNGHSINSEIHARLEQSFEQERRFEDVFGSADMFGLMRALAAIMNSAGARAQKIERREEPYGWAYSPWAYDQALKAAVRTLEALRPLGEIEAPDPRPAPEPVGERAAEDMLGLVEDERLEEIRQVRRDLGRFGDRLHLEKSK
jgi:hypothetical protein